MNLKPVGPRLVVQYKKLEPKKGSIILTAAAEEAPQFATVISISKDNAGHEFGLVKGNLIGIHRHAGQAFKVEDQLYLVVEMKDVIAKLEQENET